MELSIASLRQLHRSYQDYDAQNHIDNILPFNYTMIEY